MWAPRDQDDAFRLMRLTVSDEASGTIRLRTSYDNTLNAPGGAVLGEWVTYRFGTQPDLPLDADVPDSEPAVGPGPADEHPAADAGGSDPAGQSSPADAPEDPQPAPAPLPEAADDTDRPVAEQPSEGPTGTEPPADVPDGEPAVGPGPADEHPAADAGGSELDGQSSPADATEDAHPAPRRTPRRSARWWARRGARSGRRRPRRLCRRYGPGRRVIPGGWPGRCAARPRAVAGGGG